MSTDAERREATEQWTIQLREQQLRDLRAQLATAIARAEAAERELAMVDVYGKWMRNAPFPRTFAEWLARREQAKNEVIDLCDGIDAMRQRAEAAEAQAMELRLALGATVERANRLAIWANRFGADQWRRGASNKDPQEFDKWQKETQP